MAVLSAASFALVATSPPLPRPVLNAAVEAQARRYFSLGNCVRQQLGPTSAEDLQRELADDFEFVAPLVGPLGRDAIIAATIGLDLAEALPDFDARCATMAVTHALQAGLHAAHIQAILRR